MDEPTDRPVGFDDRDDARRAETDFAPARFAQAAAALPSPVVVLAAGRTVAYANPAVEDRFGHAPRALTGESVDALLPSLSATDLDAAAGGERTETYALSADGTELVVELSVDRRYDADGRRWDVAVVHDVTEARRRQQRLQQYERVVGTVDDGVYLLDDAFNITWVNDAIEELTGYDRDRLVGSNAAMLASEETLEQAAAVTEALLAGDTEAATLSTTIERADGETVPVETRFSVYQFDDGSYGQVGVVRDVSDRIWFEQTLTALHDATRDLLGAETPAEVCDLVVGTATEVVDLSAAAVYRFDRETNVLRPVVSDHGFDSAASLPPVTATDGFVWDAFVRGDRTVESGAEPLSVGDVSLPAETGVAVPLGDHGVFFVATDADRLDADTMEIVDLVAASTEAALERVDRQQRLRERERELRERNERLERLERTNETIRRIDRALVDASSQPDIEAAVCDGLVESELFSLAWIGRVEGDELVPTAWAGSAPGYLDGVDRSLDVGGGPPSVRTARSEEPMIVQSVVSELRTEPWRREALSEGFGSALAVPLRRDGITHGVLTVYADDRDAFGGTMRSVFAELGETIANALRVAETERWLAAESVLELDLAVEVDGCPLSQFAGALDTEVVHEGTVPMSDGAYRTFLRTDAEESAVRAAAESVTAVAAVETWTDEADGGRFEAVLSAPSVASTFTDRGARVRSLVVDGDCATATVELAPTADVRSFVEAVGSHHGPTRLTGRRERSKPGRSDSGFRAAVEERLTDRQQQVLRTAHLSGFFEWPRETTGEELAETFDVSQPTINRHLRVGERKLFELLFEDA